MNMSPHIYNFFLFLLLEGSKSFSLYRDHQSIFLPKTSAAEFFKSPASHSISRRAARTHRHDPRREFPEGAVYMRRGKRYKVKELRELQTFPGAWWGIPDNYDMKYTPTCKNYVKKIVLRNLGMGKLIDMIVNDKENKYLKVLKDMDLNEEFFSLYYRYSLCLGGHDPERNCPDPCNKRKICEDIPHTTGECESIRDRSVGLNLDGQNYTFWAPIFQRNYICGCKEDYIWDGIHHQCIEVFDYCAEGVSPCENGGTCLPDPEHTYLCNCPPAFMGKHCQLWRDPCYDGQNCGDFDCRRDETNVKTGYSCFCEGKRGFRRFSLESPICVDIDECVLQKPCQNGGICINAVGSYKCICPRSYSGQNCEDSGTKDLAKWSDWGVLRPCTVSCGTSGVQYRFRTCSQPDMCSGLNFKVANCTDLEKCPKKEDIYNDVLDLFVKLNPNDFDLSEGDNLAVLGGGKIFGKNGEEDVEKELLQIKDTNRGREMSMEPREPLDGIDRPQGAFHKPIYFASDTDRIKPKND